MHYITWLYHHLICQFVHKSAIISHWLSCICPLRRTSIQSFIFLYFKHVCDWAVLYWGVFIVNGEDSKAIIQKMLFASCLCCFWRMMWYAEVPKGSCWYFHNITACVLSWVSKTGFLGPWRYHKFSAGGGFSRSSGTGCPRNIALRTDCAMLNENTKYPITPSQPLKGPFCILNVTVNDNVFSKNGCVRRAAGGKPLLLMKDMTA